MTKEEIEKEVISHNQRNAELLGILDGKGLNETDEVDAEYHFWAFDHEDAIALAQRLYDSDFTILVISPVKVDSEITWNVEARKREGIEVVVGDVNTRRLVSIANDYNSIYDGWGAKV